MGGASAIDVLLALVAASGVLLAVVTATQPVPAVPIALSALVTLSGLIGLVLVLLRALDLPDWAGTREWGLWLGARGDHRHRRRLCASRCARSRCRAPCRPEVEAIPAPRP